MDGDLLRIEGQTPMKDLDGLSVVMPAYNEDSRLINKITNSLKSKGAEVILVDDGSDPPIRPSLVTIRLEKNQGYGAAIKAGVRRAKHSTIAICDSDGQHGVDDIVKLYKIYKMVDGCKMVVGSRWNLSEKALRRWGRKCLNFVASVIAGHYLVDLNSGMRILDRDLLLAYEPILCDVFSYTTSLTMSMVCDGHKMVWIPINVKDRVYGSSRVQVIRDGLITLKYIIVVGLAIRTRGIRSWIRSKRSSTGQ